MRELSQQQLIAQIDSRGKLPPLIGGVTVDKFNPIEVAAAIEGQVEHAKGGILPRVELHMDCDNAIQLAVALRRIAAYGENW